jgi:RNA polymerase sigma-B factor
MIEEHLGLVRAIARRYAGSSEPIEDLTQAGTIGLIKAVDRFDPRRGLPLRSLAAPSIEGEIRHHLRDRGAQPRPPRGVRELDQRVRAAESELRAKFGRAPALAEVAAAVGADEAAVAEARAARPAPATEPAPEVEDTSRNLDGAEARVLLAASSKVLGERERRILELRFYRDLTQEQIAREVGLSQAHVSRLIRGALERLRAHLGEEVAPPPKRGYSGPEMSAPASQREPRSGHSGRLLVRMPQSLHDDLVATAEQEAVSLNTLITGILASAVGWRDAAGEQDTEPAAKDTPSERPRAWRSAVLVANLVVVALAVATGLSLLVVAITGV